MGFLDKILSGTNKENSITSELNRVAQNKNQRLADGEEEKEERIRLGQDIEACYIGESRRNEFPYDCLFEWEYEMVGKVLEAKDTLQSTLDLIFCAIDYVRDNKVSNDNPLRSFNLSHYKIWIEELVQRAGKGLCAKAAFWGKNFDPLPMLWD